MGVLKPIDQGEILRPIRVYLKGRGYWFETLRAWLNEIRDLLEYEYDIKLEIIVRDGDEMPEIYVEDIFALKGVPREEGYLIELMKVAIEEVLKS